MKIIVLLMLFVSCSFKMNINNKDYNERKFNFKYSTSLESTNGEKLEVWIPLPQNSEVQTITNLVINTNGLDFTEEHETEHSNKYLYINHQSGTMKPTDIVITFDVHRKEHQNINYKGVNPDNYLSAYNTVPINGVFKEIIIENNLNKEDVRSIYNYVLSGMHYGKPKSVDNQYYKDPWLNEKDRYGLKQVSRDDIVDLYQKSKKDGNNYTFGNGNAIYACDIGVGNCTDYHSYFLSLDRTLGIPARFHMGFPIPVGNEGKVGGYHCWADYYKEGEGWYPVDISEADKMPSKAEYFFGTVDQNRVEMVVGRDLKLKGYEPDITNLFIYPIVEVNDQESKAFTKSFSYKNLN